MKWAEYFDEKTLRQTIEKLKPNNELFEIRVISKLNRKRVLSGYFTDVDTLFQQFDIIDPRSANIYITLNKVNEDCYSKAQHDCFRIADTNTPDSEIDAYEWLFIDLDPIRFTDISSSNDELKAAEVLCDKVYDYMKGLGFKEPVRAMSGNGYHLLYKISFDNTEENVSLVERCLYNLSIMFSDDAVKIDSVNFNPSRICKLYGTLAQKGANTTKRPHRMAHIISMPDVIENNTIDLLQVLADELPEPPKPQLNNNKHTNYSSNGDFDIENWMFEHGLHYSTPRSGKECTIYPLDNCPFNPNHINGDSKIFKYTTGAISFKCHHNSCHGKKWQDVRELLEPGVYEAKHRAEEDAARIEEGYKQLAQNSDWGKSESKPQTTQKTDNAKSVKKELPTLSAISAYELQNKKFDEKYYAVNDMIPEGETVIAAPPKTGKSWLMLDMCLEVAKGEKFLGFDTTKSDTLYLALEDGDSFEQERLNIVTKGQEAPKNFHFVFSNVMPMSEGFLTQLETLLETFKDVKVVVIDTLQFIKYRQTKNESAYECDYRTGRDLKQFAEERHIAIVVVTHTTKMIHTEDEMSNISGTSGVTGAADSVILISKEKRTSKDAKLFITGRKVRSSIHSISFDDNACQWNYVGVAEIKDDNEAEQKERMETYLHSKIRDAVKKIAYKLAEDNKPAWKGRASDLVFEAAKHGVGLEESNKAVGGFLTKMVGLFMDVDGILIEPICNGTGSKTYRIESKKEFMEATEEEQGIFLQNNR